MLSAVQQEENNTQVKEFKNIDGVVLYLCIWFPHNFSGEGKIRFGSPSDFYQAQSDHVTCHTIWCMMTSHINRVTRTNVFEPFGPQNKEYTERSTGHSG